MIDDEKRKKVIRGLKACVCDSLLMQCANCPYRIDKSRCVTTLMRDALALLEPQKPVITINAYGKKFYKCANCGRDFELDFANPRRVRVCSFCGQAVKWDD